MIGGLVVDEPQDVTQGPESEWAASSGQQGDVVCGGVAARETPSLGWAHPHGAAVAILSNQTSNLRQAANADLG